MSVTYGSDPVRAAAAARICERVPGLAGVFADIARGIRAFAAENQVDVAQIAPESIVTPTGRVVVSLHSPT